MFCFFPDVVFFIYLYQRYIYSVDPKRVNEFGTSQEMFDSNGTVQAGEGADAIEGDTEGGTGDEEVKEENGSAVKSEEEKKTDWFDTD